MTASRLRPARMGVMLAVGMITVGLSGVFGGTARAQTGGSALTVGGAHVRAPGRIAHHAVSGFNHLYVDTGDGTQCGPPGGAQDAIDVFDSSGNLVQTFPTRANTCYAFFGSNTLAYVATKTQACLVLADLNYNNTQGYGFWYSYSINMANGQITGQVSQVADKYKAFPMYGTPEDVVAVPSGKAVVGVDNTGNVELLTVGHSCKLGHPSVAAGAGSSVFNVTLQQISGGKTPKYDAYAADFQNNAIDVFGLKPFALLKSIPAGVSSGVDGIAGLGNTIAVGSAAAQGNIASQVASGTSSGPSITWGGTAGDTGAGNQNTQDVGLASGCLFGGDEEVGGTPTAYVSWFTLAGSPPAPSWVGDQALPNGSSLVGPLVNAGSTELVDSLLGGVVYQSSIGAGCALNLTPFAVLSDANGDSNGVAVD
ncbi:MAG TPA: hypothetical protein VKX16_08440 [Chloroflexota bacterium]|nr:hypothetical protein [Chloroflexota bacterium]